MKTLIIGVLAAASLAAALPAAAQPIDQREQRQNHRIEQGVRSDELTPRQAHRLHRREASIRHEERVMRERHGGRLNAYDRHVLNRRLDRNSNAIFVKKHDGQVR